MVFSSLIFLFFFLPSVTLAYFSFFNRIKVQNLILALSSLGFYYWGEKDHILIMLACIWVNYASAMMIEDSQNAKYRKLYLMASVTASLCLLFYFKYFNFFVSAAHHWVNFDVNNIRQVVLPLGISFYTFHSLSYVIDVYWKKIKAERNIVTFVGYVSLFPQLVAGPIVRYCDISRSFYHRYITRAGLRNGILRFCFGLGKKVLIANQVATIADVVFNLPSTELTAGIAWLGAIAYAIQIYFDFSGYSDMAIGIGLMFGFRYKENFNLPYRALSIQEFWRKWHISLSSWFRDYVYIPLGGNRASNARTFLNLLIVFGLCGFWHGANYTFVIWGLFHGLFLIIERTRFSRLLDAMPRILRHTYVLTVVTIGWVFFREDSLARALHFLKSMLGLQHISLQGVTNFASPLALVALGLGAVISLGIGENIKKTITASRNTTAIFLLKQCNYVLALTILLLSLMPLSNNSYNPFLYFKF